MHAGTEWLVPKSPVAFHSLGLLPVCIALAARLIDLGVDLLPAAQRIAMSSVRPGVLATLLL